MTVRVDVSPEVLLWARNVASSPADQIEHAFPKFAAWVAGNSRPTVNELVKFAGRVGVPFGYLLLPEPPAWELPIPDFREGFGGTPSTPSANLIDVLNQSLRRQDWYRDYALANDLPEVEMVGVASDWNPSQAAADILERLAFNVSSRKGSWNDTRKYLLRRFEALGGLTVATSMVGNNTYRPLDPHEFRGFSLVDDLAPLIFVNSKQTLNGQIFTIAHELAHIWRRRSGLSDEEPRFVGQSEVEQWCNAVASLVLVPVTDLANHWPKVMQLPLTRQLDELASIFKCGTLVILQALRRDHLYVFDDFDVAYSTEEARLKKLSEDNSSTSPGGDHYNNQPFRVGERLSRAVIGDTFEGRTTFTEAMSLMSMKSATSFDEYARRLGVA